jgi:O-antigen ligase
MAFKLYIFYVVSVFLHLASKRFPALGTIRFDMLLVVAITIAILLTKTKHPRFDNLNNTGKILIALFAYIVLSLPFVEWPGSVIKVGLEGFVKAVIFYYFTIFIIDTEKRLKIFLVVFIACQTFRILEPVYLHIFHGYWGDTTFMGVGQIMPRLAGSPHDTINPNGLAFVIMTIIPFYHYLALPSGWKFKIIYFCVMPLFIYALILTASRSGLLTLTVFAAALMLKSKKKVLYILVLLVLVIAVLFNLSPIQRDRYLSIYRSDVRGASTAHERIEGLKSNFELIRQKPLVGYGLGTSLEANYNLNQIGLVTHNLYLEVWQELGLFGLILFLLFIISNLQGYRRLLLQVQGTQNHYIINVTKTLGAWFLIFLVFSFASYGLSGYTLYLLVGLVESIIRITAKETSTQTS